MSNWEGRRSVVDVGTHGSLWQGRLIIVESEKFAHADLIAGRSGLGAALLFYLRLN